MKAKKKRWVRRCVIGTVVVLLLGVGLTMYLLSRPPQVWRNAQQVLEQTTPEAREQISQNVMRRLGELVQTDQHLTDQIQTEKLDLYDVKGTKLSLDTLSEQPLDQFVELRLTNEELIALVNEMFVEWTLQRGYVVAGGINDPVVMADKGQLKLAFMVSTPYWQQVFSGDLELKFHPDGMATGRVENLYGGSLPVSVVSVGETLRMQMPASEADAADRIGKWLAKLKGFDFRPTLELEHRRRARIVSMKVGDDEVTLRMRVQDHETYRQYNELLKKGQVAVTETLKSNSWDGSAFADVPTTTD